jgi:hypothetical protein
MSPELRSLQTAVHQSDLGPEGLYPGEADPERPFISDRMDARECLSADPGARSGHMCTPTSTV